MKRLTVALVGLMTVAGVSPVAALTPLDFGTVNVGASSIKSQVVPLTASLSELDPATVLYAGGESVIDLLLPFYGLSAPVTAGSLYAAIGDVTATYHVDLVVSPGTDFSVDDSTCLTGTGSCTAEITFTPSTTGPLGAVVTGTILDIDVNSSDELLNFMGPNLADAVDDSLSLDLSGIGVPNTGSVGATVTVPASAACLELSTSAIDFGTLPLGSVDSPATPDITVTNCSGLSETIYASGTDATGPAGAHWSLTDADAACAALTLGLDAYRLRLADGGVPVELSTSNKSLGSLSSGLGTTDTARIDLACPGSTGAGTTMTLQILYLATSEG
ncbi:MAG: hypothetical protein EPO36_12360 [Chloroflexota bacterium]|nr:MAG: hypothetical protein EPO36_12360 [Chloroflexota bacterium]